MGHCKRIAGTLFPAALAVALALMLWGCGGQKLTIKPYPSGSGEAVSGVVARMPKTVMLVEITEVRSLAKTGNYEINSTPQIEPLAVANPEAAYYFDPDELGDFFTSVPEAQFDLSGNMVLTGVNVTVEDKTAERIEDLVSVVTAFSGRVTEAGGSRGDENVGTKRFAAILDPCQLDELGKDAKHSLSVKLFSDEYKMHITFSSPTGDDMSSLCNNQFTFDADAGKAELISLSAGDGKKSDEKKFKGLPYPIPKDLLVEVFLGKERAFSEIVPFPQFGTVAYIPITKKALAKRTMKLTYSSEYGTLTQYKTTQDSRDEKIDKLIEQIQLLKQSGQ